MVADVHQCSNLLQAKQSGRVGSKKGAEAPLMGLIALFSSLLQ